MRYHGLFLCTQVVLKDFNHIAFVSFSYSLDKTATVKLIPKKWLLLKKKHNMCCGLLKQDRIRRLRETTERKYRGDPPSRPSVRAWHETFMRTGTVMDKGRSRRLRTSEENMDGARQALHRSPPKSKTRTCVCTKSLRSSCFQWFI